MKSVIFLYIIIFLLSGCVATQKPLMPVDPEPVLSPEQLQDELLSHEQRLTQTIVGIFQQSQQSQQLMQIDADLNTLLAQVDKINERSKRVRRAVAKVEKAYPPKAPPLIEDKLLLGEREWVYLNEFEHVFTAYIDPGVDSSMLKVDNINLFERDGDQWVRFDVLLPGDNKSESETVKTFKLKVQRMIRIKSRSSDKKSLRYPVIQVNLKIGKYQGMTDIYLGTQGKRKHALVLGRKFLKDIAVIDISQTFIQGKTSLHNSK
ncbi:MAG: hypothetical protein GXP14_09765 [Gammaproteobacteria bacterium]|nr:hypothetical protein [Gammaproteobacteria bacterium]